MAKNETDDTEERLLSSYPLDLESDLQRREAELAAAQRQFRWIRLSSYALFATALCLFSATWVMQHSGNADGSCSELQCAKITSPYSPAWEAVELWEGEFTNFFNHTSKYRGPPTLELEAAWDKLWNTAGISIDQAGLDALNKSQPGKQYANSLESTPEKPLYAASLEVTHQLHCLNLIRQATWPLSQFNKTWETYPSVLDDDIAGRLHVDHCVETLRLSLMCYSDVTPLLAELTPDRPGGFQLDFNVHHKCRNFDKVTEFLHEHGSDVRVDEDGQPI